MLEANCTDLKTQLYFLNFRKKGCSAMASQCFLSFAKLAAIAGCEGDGCNDADNKHVDNDSIKGGVEIY